MKGEIDMRKLFYLIIIMGLLAIGSTAFAEDDLLSDTNMETWKNAILFLIIDDMDFLAKTKPIDLPRHLISLKYIPDKPMDKNDIEAALIDMSPKQTYEQLGGDCEDLTIYAIARMLQSKSYYDIGFMLIRSPKSKEQNSQHIVPVILKENSQIIVYDLSQDVDMKRMPLDEYLSYWNLIAPKFDAYRIWWIFCLNDTQPKIENIKERK